MVRGQYRIGRNSIGGWAVRGIYNTAFIRKSYKSGVQVVINIVGYLLYGLFVELIYVNIRLAIFNSAEYQVFLSSINFISWICSNIGNSCFMRLSLAIISYTNNFIFPSSL
jgi:hypothetical protein